MEQEEVEELIKSISEPAEKRHRQLRNLIIASWVYALVFTCIFCLSLNNLTHSNRDLSEVIERRSPVLDYLRCHDNLEDTKSNLQTELVLTYLDNQSNPSEEGEIKFKEVRIKYEKASEKLMNADSCPDFPQ